MLQPKNNKEKLKDFTFELFKYFIIGIVTTASIWCILSSLPYFFVRWGKNLGFDDKTGFIGDTLGGTLGPIIGIVGAILTFSAFYIQYEANQLQRLDLAKERFENRFYELLRLHKENVSEMKIAARDIVTAKSTINDYSSLPKDEMSENQINVEIRGRDVFQDMHKEFLSCYRICKEALHFEESVRDNEKYIIEVSYKIFFYGLTSPLTKKINQKVIRDEEYVKMCKVHIQNAAKLTINNLGKSINYMPADRSFARPIILSTKYAPFLGQSNQLGYYYRHLFLIVKYVVNQSDKLFSYNDKREYLRILRAQLSNNEQLMLYFNYLAGIGTNWENEQNKFFSIYRMIHNLPLELADAVFSPTIEFNAQIKEIRESGEEMFEYHE